MGQQFYDYRHPTYVQNQFVGTVDMLQFTGPLEVPLPRRWYVLRTHPGRESKVMRTFRQRNISAWLPLITAMQDIKCYRRGYEWIERRNVISPLISGVILIPDFEAHGGRWCGIGGVIDIFRMGLCTPCLTPKDIIDLRNIEAIGNTPKSKREHLFEIGQLVRVVNGPFRQFCARIERFDSKGRLSVGVEIFGRISPVELSDRDIEAV